jgi:hypothetical protein
MAVEVYTWTRWPPMYRVPPPAGLRAGRAAPSGHREHHKDLDDGAECDRAQWPRAMHGQTLHEDCADDVCIGGAPMDLCRFSGFQRLSTSVGCRRFRAILTGTLKGAAVHCCRQGMVGPPSSVVLTRGCSVQLPAFTPSAGSALPGFTSPSGFPPHGRPGIVTIRSLSSINGICLIVRRKLVTGSRRWP